VRTRVGAGLAPLRDRLPSETLGLAPAVAAALREVEQEIAEPYRLRGALLGYDATMRTAQRIADRLSMDVYVASPAEFVVTST